MEKIVFFDIALGTSLSAMKTRTILISEIYFIVYYHNLPVTYIDF